ncbi:MAG: replicative DNA helicase [Desulfobacteraceae bacterium]|nr:MAG: replicative DNA helicase [Desulfobacteraceae bacterium]
MPPLLKVPPHNLEAEQAILGGILLNNDAIIQILEIISADDFYREVNGVIFGCMAKLFEQGEPIDVITLAQALSEKGHLEAAGGTDYLVALAESVSTSAGIAFHAQIVRNLSVKRKLITQCSNISESCFREWEKTEDLLELAEQSIYNIAETHIRGGLESLREVIKTTFDRIANLSASDGYITGIPTGFVDFDRKTAGLQPSDLIILAGRPGMGKTALALNIAHHAAWKTKKAVVIFSLEMAKSQLGLRLLGFDSGVDANRLRTGFIKDEEYVKLSTAAENLSDLDIFIDDSSAVTVLEMKAKCRRLKKRMELGLIVVDYLQLIQGRGNFESRQIEISDISRSLKAMAKDLNVPVLALSQLNRRVEERQTKKPQLSDLRESGAIEQDADVIVFIYKEDGQKLGVQGPGTIVDISIEKQRNGPTGSFRLFFQKELTRFKDFTEIHGAV